MKKISAPDITVKHPNLKTTILIPGGWDVYVPEVSADALSHRAFTSFFASDMSPAAAAARATDVIQRVFDAGYVKGIRDAIANRAVEYASRYPDLCQEAKRKGSRRRYVTLVGFDAKELQSTYVPFQNAGRAGLPAIHAALDEMAQAARKAA